MQTVINEQSGLFCSGEYPCKEYACPMAAGCKLYNEVETMKKHKLYFTISSRAPGASDGDIFCEMELTFKREIPYEELAGMVNKTKLAEILQVDPDRLTIVTPEEYERRYEID